MSHLEYQSITPQHNSDTATQHTVSVSECALAKATGQQRALVQSRLSIPQTPCHLPPPPVVELYGTSNLYGFYPNFNICIYVQGFLCIFKY